MEKLCRAVLAVILLFAAAPGEARLINGINVIVNDSIITYQEVEEAIAPVVEVLIRQHSHQPQVFEQRLQQVRAEKLEELIERQLILHEFEKAGYNLPESFVDDAIEKRIQREYGDRATMTRTLQAQGMRFEQYRQQLRDQIVIGEMRRFHVSPEKIHISPHRIEVFYLENQDRFALDDQVRLSMIVINKSASRSSEAARGLVEEIRSKLEEGASFAEMATIYSDGSQRAQGGHRGWVDRTFLREELTEVAFSLEAGRHSEVIDLPEAVYLLRVEEVRSAHVKPLEDVRQEIEETLKGQEAARLYQRWINRLKQNSFLRYY